MNLSVKHTFLCAMLEYQLRYSPRHFSKDRESTTSEGSLTLCWPSEVRKRIFPDTFTHWCCPWKQVEKNKTNQKLCFSPTLQNFKYLKTLHGTHGLLFSGVVSPWSRKRWPPHMMSYDRWASVAQGLNQLFLPWCDFQNLKNLSPGVAYWSKKVKQFHLWISLWSIVGMQWENSDFEQWISWNDFCYER